MVAKVTNTLAQFALGAAAVLAVIFPSPQDAVTAVRDVVQTPQMEVSLNSDRIVIEPGAAQTREVISVDEVTLCLGNDPSRDLDGLNRCAEVLYDDLQKHEKPVAVKQMERIVGRPRNDTYYETQRLALTRICRAIWAENGGDAGALDTPACYFTVSGVEKPV